MIAKGAKIIFATSYGHLDPALKVAAAHPDVVVVSQGNFVDGTMPANFGTYFGTVYEPVYLAGIAAGKATKTQQARLRLRLPDPADDRQHQRLRARRQVGEPRRRRPTWSTRRTGVTRPSRPRRPTACSRQGVDVITQHQDCTETIIKAAEAAGKMTVGYHADASALAPKGWLTGSEWNWGPLYTDIVKTTLDGKFTGSKYNANYRVGYKDGENPFIQSKFGSLVTADTQKLIADAKTKISAATGSPFVGPLKNKKARIVSRREIPPQKKEEDLCLEPRRRRDRQDPQDVMSHSSQAPPLGFRPVPTDADTRIGRHRNDPALKPSCRWITDVRRS